MPKFLRNLFGTKKEKGNSTSMAMSKSAEVIRKLQDTEEMFKKKQRYLEEQIEEQFIIVRANLTKNKLRKTQIQLLQYFKAKRALIKKKRLEKMLSDASAQLINLEVQREALESARINTEVFKTMTGAAGVLKIAHKTMDVDKVHQVMDDIAEQQDIGQEIFDAISKPTGLGQVDDDDLEKELDALTQEDLDSTLLAVGKRSPTSTTEDIDNASDDDKKAQGPSSFKAKAKPNSINKTTGLSKQEEDDLMALEKWATTH